MKKRLSPTPTQRKLMLATGDALLLLGAVGVASLLWTGTVGQVIDRHLWLALPSGWLFIGLIVGVYHQEAVGSFERSLKALLKCLLVIVALYFVIYFFLPPKTVPRGVFLLHNVFSYGLLAGWRYFFLRATELYVPKRRCIILGDRDEVDAIATFLKRQPFFEVIPVAEYSDISNSQNGKQDLLSFVDAHGVNEIIIGETADLELENRESLLKARERGTLITPVSHVYENLTTRVPVDFLGKRGWPLVLIGSTAADFDLYMVEKRLFDLGMSLLGLVGFALLFPFVALMIKLDSRGPVFYGQDRVGKAGNHFTVWKLRTMMAGAEKDEGLWSQAQDPRVTRVGKLLRKARIDELPQAWNVLKGEMSIVGPRPERPQVVDKLESEFPFYRLRHVVKPGMAGWAMVNRGNMLSFDDAKTRLEYDLYYVKHQCFWLDMVIVARAIEQLLRLKGF